MPGAANSRLYEQLIAPEAQVVSLRRLLLYIAADNMSCFWSEPQPLRLPIAARLLQLRSHESKVSPEQLRSQLSVHT